MARIAFAHRARCTLAAAAEVEACACGTSAATRAARSLSVSLQRVQAPKVTPAAHAFAKPIRRNQSAKITTCVVVVVFSPCVKTVKTNESPSKVGPVLGQVQGRPEWHIFAEQKSTFCSSIASRLLPQDGCWPNGGALLKNSPPASKAKKDDDDDEEERKRD